MTAQARQLGKQYHMCNGCGALNGCESFEKENDCPSCGLKKFCLDQITSANTTFKGTCIACEKRGFVVGRTPAAAL